MLVCEFATQYRAPRPVLAAPEMRRGSRYKLPALSSIAAWSRSRPSRRGCRGGNGPADHANREQRSRHRIAGQSWPVRARLDAGIPCTSEQPDPGSGSVAERHRRAGKGIHCQVCRQRPPGEPLRAKRSGIGGFVATSLLAVLAALQLDGLRLEDLRTARG
jgi:hypothetical protein